MDARLNELYDLFTQKQHIGHRKRFETDLAAEFSGRSLSPTERVSERLARLLAFETPLIFEGERIAITRTTINIPPIFTDAEWDAIKAKHFLHEAGSVCNINPGYEDIIESGLEPIRLICVHRLMEQISADQRALYQAVLLEIEALYDLTDRYRAEAERMVNPELAEMFTRLPRQGARSFHEALQMFRILHFTLWMEGEYHNTVGRFDQYMYPYLKADMDKGLLDREGAQALVTEFFLSFNKDSDLYPGVQQGDNGQSLVLGGVDKDGQDGFNLLSEMCLEASKTLKLIDPKINLRVGKGTDLATYELGTQLTKAGLGFPQYENDDVVIPGLTALGYAPEHAANYVVAACWEFIIPKYGMDIPNIGALSYPKVLERCVMEHLSGCDSFEQFQAVVHQELIRECDQIIAGLSNLWMVPAPFMSIMMDDCIESGRDISLGATYNNYGLHGTGLSTATDSLAAIRKYVFEEKRIPADRLVQALQYDFEGEDELLHMLRFEAPKLGNNIDEVDQLAAWLLSEFAEALRGRRNERGGCFRAGTGSAMFYLWHAAEVGASADGRRKGEPFSANYSPSLFARIDGPLSVIQSFTKPNLRNVVNGGPLTMELHASVFVEQSGVTKVAQLVRQFIEMGGHQLQLNAVNHDLLVQAQKRPDQYKNLIVRVWGWSAYFVELDKQYQDHVMTRQEYTK